MRSKQHCRQSYVERLRQAGVSVELSRYDGVNHGFMFWAGVVERPARR